MNCLKSVFKPVDMTVGEPWKKILFFSIPLLLGNLAQQLYNTVDSIVVGKYIGDNALAAVGSAGPILNLLLVFFIGISVGVSILVSQYFGAKDSVNLSKTVGNCISLTFFATLLIIILSSFAIRPLLELLKTPESIIDWCHSYLMIFLFGIGGFAYYNILTGVLRGLGNSISALLYLLIATILNIILDIVFVAYFNMGVNGVALATIIAQSFSALLCIMKLRNMKDLFVLSRNDLKLDKKTCTDILKLGLPSGFTQAIFSFAMISTQALTNSFGELYIAANVIIMRIDSFAMMPVFSFGNAMTTYSGQNVGAKNFDRLHDGTKKGTFLSVLISGTITICLLLFGEHLMVLFTDTPELISVSMRMMRYLAFGYVSMAVTQSLCGVMRGAGDTITPMWIGIFTTVIVRVPLAYFLAYITRSDLYPNGNPATLFISLLTAWVLGAILTTFAFSRKKWMSKLSL